ncbi:uncharacterized protein LOC126993112 isoform X7 [Eriocheir sinensis]|uniref:uncharacterized protein LOC126993112 isoform X7 n=1 Tax=Eriocheir sinensis TaxID=95602 RepID=UPI0021C869AD|nr:uncharacterized protein LOC126993112 isoform X7 [Eriocheir sinensis]
MGLRGSVVSTLGSQPREPGFDSWVEWKNLGGFSNTLRPCPPSSVPGWCSSAGRCHNTGHSSPQQQSLHRQVILHQQAFQQLGEIDTTKRRRGGGGGLGRRRGTQEEPIERTRRRRRRRRRGGHRNSLVGVAVLGGAITQGTPHLNNSLFTDK